VTVGEPTYYELLGVAPTAKKDEIKAAVERARADAQGDAEAQAAIQRAWQKLADEQQRKRYDEQLGLTGRGAAVPAVVVPESADKVSGGEVATTAGSALESTDDFPGDPTVNAELRPVKGRSNAHLPIGSPAFLEQPSSGRRLVAALIDAVTVLVGFLITVTITLQVAGNPKGTTQVVFFVFWVEAWILAQYVLPTMRTGQTLGKRFTYIQTVDRATGDALTPGQVIRRYLLPMLAIPLLLQMGAFLALFYGLSFAMARDQISLADRLGKSIVVVARYRPARRGRAG